MMESSVYDYFPSQPTTAFESPRVLYGSSTRMWLRFNRLCRLYLGYLPISIDRTAKRLWRWNNVLIEQRISAQGSLRLASFFKVAKSLRPHRYILQHGQQQQQQQHVLVFATSDICDIASMSELRYSRTPARLRHGPTQQGDV